MSPFLITFLIGVGLAIIAYFLNLRLKSRERAVEQQDSARKAVEAARRAFRNRVAVTVEKLNTANETETFRIHQESLESIRNESANVLEFISEDQRTRFDGVRTKYYQMEDMARARSGMLLESDRPFVRSKKNCMIQLRTEMADCAK
jgi:phage shock protein A